MKTLKLVLIATVLVFTSVSLTNADGFKERPPKFIKIVNLSINQAVQDQGLVMAIYDQIDWKIFIGDLHYPYMAEILYRKSLYRINGTRNQWVIFFRRIGINQPEGRNAGRQQD